VILAAAALAGLAPPFPEKWSCSSRSEFDGVSTHVVRELDDKGRQLTSHVQWSAGGKGFSANVFGDVHQKAAGNPPLRTGTLLISWRGQVAEGVDRSLPLVVLHAEGETPKRADGRQQIQRTDGSISAEVPWSRVLQLSRRADRAKVSLVNAKGQVIQSSRVDLRQIRRALVVIEEGLGQTRWQMHDFKKRCEPITEHMRL
jgi:hypothetical protein